MVSPLVQTVADVHQHMQTVADVHQHMHPDAAATAAAFVNQHNLPVGTHQSFQNLSLSDLGVDGSQAWNLENNISGTGWRLVWIPNSAQHHDGLLILVRGPCPDWKNDTIPEMIVIHAGMDHWYYSRYVQAGDDGTPLHYYSNEVENIGISVDKDGVHVWRLVPKGDYWEGCPASEITDPNLSR